MRRLDAVERMRSGEHARATRSGTAARRHGPCRVPNLVLSSTVFDEIVYPRPVSIVDSHSNLVNAEHGWISPEQCEFVAIKAANVHAVRAGVSRCRKSATHGEGRPDELLGRECVSPLDRRQDLRRTGVVDQIFAKITPEYLTRIEHGIWNLAVH